jgi:hypothetical protein
VRRYSALTTLQGFGRNPNDLPNIMERSLTMYEHGIVPEAPGIVVWTGILRNVAGDAVIARVRCTYTSAGYIPRMFVVCVWGWGVGVGNIPCRTSCVIARNDPLRMGLYAEYLMVRDGTVLDLSPIALRGREGIVRHVPALLQWPSNGDAEVAGDEAAEDDPARCAHPCFFRVRWCRNVEHAGSIHAVCQPCPVVCPGPGVGAAPLLLVV